MRKLILPVAALSMFVLACSNPRDGGTGDEEIKGNSGNMPEVSDTTIVIPDSTRNAGTTGMPGVNTVTGDTMTKYSDHTTGFSGSGTEDQIQKSGNTQNTQTNKNNQNNQKK